MLGGYCLGSVDARPLPRHVGQPLRELERSIRSVLGRQLFVSFSGGCDSSLVLATATRVCRAAGVADPVPITVRYPDLAETDEQRWQELIVRHLGLRDWEILEIHAELDAVGPVAGRLLQRHGAFASAFVYAQQPYLPVARGGVLLTGEGGDETLGSHRMTPALTIAHRAMHRQRPSAGQLGQTAQSIVPEPVRRRRASRAMEANLPWLRPQARHDVAQRIAAEDAAWPWSPRRSMARYLARRMLVWTLHNFDELARPFDVTYLHPLLEPRLVASVVQGTRVLRCRGRATVLDAYFADLLPEALRHRSDKVAFTTSYFNEHTRAFAGSWDGTGLPDEVDAEALRDLWLSDRPSGLTALLLQQAWLHAHPMSGSAR